MLKFALYMTIKNPRGNTSAYFILNPPYQFVNFDNLSLIR